MQQFLALRFMHLIPTVLGVTIFVFLMMQALPADPITAQLARTEIDLSEEQIQEIRVRYGLDRPLHIQYLTWLGNIFRGDWGISYHIGGDIATLLSRNIGPTVELSVIGLLITIVFGIPLGVISAVKHGSWLDSISTVLATIGIAMPGFWLGLMLMWLFAISLGWLPIYGMGSLRHLILPGVTLGIAGVAIVARMTRSSLVEILGLDFIRTARAKGLTERAVIYKHGLRNAMIPVITIVTLSLGRLLSGAIIIENVFGRSGLGRLGVRAVMERDYPVVQATVLLIALAVVGANLVADIAYGLVDPRIRYD